MLAKEAVRMLRPMTVLYSGPMEAGKTYHLLREVQTLLRTPHPAPFEGPAIIAQEGDDSDASSSSTSTMFSSAVFCKPNLDTRTEPASIASRNGSAIQGVQALDSLDGVAAALRPDTLVAVDEAQFFDASLLRLHERVQQTPGCTLVVAGLDRDFRREPFGHVLNLAQQIITGPGSGRVHMLRAPCHVEGCAAPAAYTLRTVASDARILIGDSDSYAPACPEHHSF
jgi:thymidine kinase